MPLWVNQLRNLVNAMRGLALWQSPSSQVGPEALRGPDPMNPEFRAVLWT